MGIQLILLVLAKMYFLGVWYFKTKDKPLTGEDILKISGLFWLFIISVNTL